MVTSGAAYKHEILEGLYLSPQKSTEHHRLGHQIPSLEYVRLKLRFR